MNGTELINFVKDNISAFVTPVFNIAASLMVAIHLRKKNSIETSTQEFEKIKAGHLREAADELLKSGKMTYTEYYKMNNFLDIAKRADELWREQQEEETEEEKEKTEQKLYDFDWFMRFYEATGTVSDDEMQELWAKILAGEISQQGSYSLRTLETLRNLSKTEAVLFQKICSCSMSNGANLFLPNYDEYLDFVHIAFGEVLKLSEYGLILCDGFLSLNIPVGSVELINVCNNEKFMMFAKGKEELEDKVLKIKQFPFTNAGKELSGIIDISALDESILYFGKLLKDRKGDKFDFSIYHIKSFEDDKIVCEEVTL